MLLLVVFFLLVFVDFYLFFKIIKEMVALEVY